MTAGVQSVADQIDALSPPDALRLAANLLEQRRPELAQVIVDRIGDELRAAMVLLTRSDPEGR